MAQAEPWDGLEDAFAPLRQLISGKGRLVPEDVYERVRGSTARVISSVCAVEASQPWGFFAVAGTEWGAPRWVYLGGTSADPETDLEKISQLLRGHLTPETRGHELDEGTAALLGRFVTRLTDTERLLLPKKKQRALDEMKLVLESYQKHERKPRITKDSDRLKVVGDLLGCLNHRTHNSAIDLARLAEGWLDIIRPVWYEYLHRKRLEPLRLKHIRPSLIGDKPLPTRDLEAILDSVCTVKPLAERVVAAIVGVA